MNPDCMAKISDSSQGWNKRDLAILYFNNSFLQIEWAIYLLSSLSEYNESSSNLIYKTLLDFGCGDGKISAIMSRLIVPCGQVYGFDISPQMLEIAKTRFSKENYKNLEFISDMNMPSSVDIITSFCVFHLVPNPCEIISKMHDKLVDNGLLLLIIPNGQNQIFIETRNKLFEKYAIKNSILTTDNPIRTLNFATEILTINGFDILKNDEIYTRDKFFNRENLIDWCCGTLAANWNIPMDLNKKFFTELINIYLEKRPSETSETSGMVYLEFMHLNIIARKKTRKTSKILNKL